MKLKLLIASIFVIISLVSYQKYTEYTFLKSIDSYESCISANGSIIQESYPATCVTRIGTRFTQVIIPTDTTLPPNTYNECGSSLPKIKFSFQVPTGWTVAKSNQSKLYQEYKILSSDQKQHLEINCGDGFGGGGYPPEDETIMTISGTDVQSFIHKDVDTGLSSIGLTYLTKDQITFSFTGKLERKYLDQILASFKFTD
jgi:hypothetical protein